MLLIILLVFILLAVGGTGYGYRSGGFQGAAPGSGILGIVLLFVVLYLLFGHAGHGYY